MNNNYKNKRKLSSETIDLIKKAMDGEIDAKNLLIEKCLGLVQYIVYKEIGQTTIEKDELVSVGYMGLIGAVSKFIKKENMQIYYAKAVNEQSNYYEKFIPYIYTSVKNSILMELRKLSKEVKTVSMDETVLSGSDGDNDIKLSDIISDGKDFVSDFIDEESSKKLYGLLKKLPDEDRKIIMLYFGFYNNVKVPINKIAQYLKVDESIIYKRIVNILENFRNEMLSKEEKNVLEEKNEFVRLSNNKTIYEHFNNYSKDEVDNAVATLNEDDMQILYKRFGTDFSIPISSYSLEGKEKRRLTVVLCVKLKFRLKNPSKFVNKTIYDYFKEYSQEEVDGIISRLNENDMNLLYKRFGTDFSIPISSYSLDDAEKRRLVNILSRIRYRLKPKMAKSQVIISRINKTIYDYFKEYSQEEVDIAISKLSADDIVILHKRFGDNFNIPILFYSLNDEEKARLIIILRKKIKARLRNPKKVFGRVLVYDYFKEYSREEINLAIANLNENNKRILHKRFGDDFNIPISSYSLNESEKILLSGILSRTMKTKLKNLSNNNKTIYDYFKDYSHEEVDIAISKLSADDIAILHKRFGDNFNISVSSYSLTDVEKAKVTSILYKKMKIRLKYPSKFLNKTIYDYFTDYSYEEVNVAISKLSEDDIEILRKKFGNDFNFPVSSCSLNDIEKARLSNALNKMRYKLEPKMTNVQAVINKTIYDYFKEYSREEVDIAIGKLSEDNMKILHKRFGDDFNVPVLSYSLDDVERTRLASILQKKMKARLRNPEKVFGEVLIYDYFKGYSHEEIDKAIHLLSEDNMKILHKRFGDDFNVSISSYSLNESESKLLYNILNMRIKSRLENPQNFINKTIYEYFEGYSKDEVDKAISLLNENDIEILHKRFGDDFNVSISSYSLDKAERIKLASILKRKINLRLRNPEVNVNKTIYDYFKGYSHEEVNRAISTLNDNNKKILHKRFGDDFNVPVLSYSLDKAEKGALFNVLNKAMKSRLENTEVIINKTIYEYFDGYSKDEVDKAISSLNDDAIKILRIRFGNDFNVPVSSYSLDKNERSKLTNILYSKVKTRLKNPEKIFNKILIYDYFKEYSKDEVDKVISTLNDNNKKILHKRFGDDFNVPDSSYSLDESETISLKGILYTAMKLKLEKNANKNFGELDCNEKLQSGGYVRKLKK